MLWLHKDKQGQMMQRYKERARDAEFLKRDCAIQRLLTNHILVTKRAFESADADAHEFSTLFEEPMPDHLHTAVFQETNLWVVLHTTLESARQLQLSTENYQRLIPQVHRILNRIIALIDIEREILYSPLTKRFNDRLQQLRELKL
jgi:hypothetical protein